MKTIFSSTYQKKESQLSGLTYSPSQEDEFADLAEQDSTKLRNLGGPLNRIKRRSLPLGTSRPMSRNEFQNIQNNPPSEDENRIERKERIRKGVEKYRRLYRDDVLTQDEINNMERDLGLWEDKTGKKIPAYLLPGALRNMRRYSPVGSRISRPSPPPIYRDDYGKTAFINNPEAEREAQDLKEKHAIFEFLNSIDEYLVDFALLKDVDPDLLRDSLGL